MIIEIATVTITEGQQKEFEEAFSQAQRYLAEAPHCLGYHLTHCLEVANRYILRIEWETLESHTQLFWKSPAYQEFRALVYPFYKTTPEVLHYEEIELLATSIA